MPMLFLTVRNSEIDREVGLELGADGERVGGFGVWRELDEAGQRLPDGRAGDQILGFVPDAGVCGVFSVRGGVRAAVERAQLPVGGGGVGLFYLGTHTLHGFMDFGAAYALAAAAASTALIGLDGKSILRSGRRAWVEAGMFGGVYGFCILCSRWKILHCWRARGRCLWYWRRCWWRRVNSTASKERRRKPRHEAMTFTALALRVVRRAACACAGAMGGIGLAAEARGRDFLAHEFV